LYKYPGVYKYVFRYTSPAPEKRGRIYIHLSGAGEVLIHFSGAGEVLIYTSLAPERPEKPGKYLFTPKYSSSS